MSLISKGSLSLQYMYTASCWDPDLFLQFLSLARRPARGAEKVERQTQTQAEALNLAPTGSWNWKGHLKPTWHGDTGALREPWPQEALPAGPPGYRLCSMYVCRMQGRGVAGTFLLSLSPVSE